MARSSATLMIDIAADIAKLRTGFTQAEQIVGNFGKKMQSLNRTVKVGLAGLGIGLGVNAIRQMASSAGDIGESAEAVGLGVENFQALTIAMKQAGVESEKVSSILAKSATLFGKALGGDKSSIETLDKLGVKLLDASGNAVDFDESLIELAKAIDGIEDPMQKVSAAREAFGKGGERVIPVLANMARGFATLRSEAALGILSKEAVTNLDNFFDRAGVLTTFLKTQFLEGLNAAGSNLAFKESMRDMDTAVVNLSKSMKAFTDSGTMGLIGEGFRLLLAPITITINGISAVISALAKVPAAVEVAVNRVKVAWLDFQVWLGETFGLGGPGEADDIARWKAEADKARGGPSMGREEAAKGRRSASDLQGFEDPKKKGTGSPTPDDKGAGAEKLRGMLEKIRDEATKATDAVLILRQKMSAPVDDPAAARDAEMWATVTARIAEVEKEFKDAKLTPSDADRANFKKWITDTEQQKVHFEHLTEVMKTAEDVRKTWGDGTVELTEQQKLLDEALKLNLITVDQYANALKVAKEAQEEQAAAADKMKTGLDGIAAGFSYAMARAARANTEFEMGEKIFQSLFSAMADAIKQFVETGNVEFGKLAQSFAAMLAEMAAQLAAKAAMTLILNALSSGISAASFGGPTMSGADSPASGAFPHGSTGLSWFGRNVSGPLGMTGRAVGGPVSAGQPFMVGENGPERFVPSIAGRIDPNPGGGNVTINNNAPGVDVRTERSSDGDLLFTIEKVRAALTRDVRRGGNPFSVALGQAYGVARTGR